MKTPESIASIVVGVAIAWFIINMTKTSTFTLNPSPLETDELVGVGLATALPKKSVMDADTTPAPSVVLMNSSPATPMSPAPLTMAPEAPATVLNPQTSMAPVPMSPQPMMPPPMMPPPMMPPPMMPQNMMPMMAPPPSPVA